MGGTHGETNGTVMRGLASRAVKGFAAGVDRLRSDRRGVVVLLYHRVGADSDVEMDLPVDLFERQMTRLAEIGCAVSLEEALIALEGSPPAEDPVVVTFDDGTADLLEHALPILVRHRIPATVYLATDFVERQRSFPHDGKPLSWGGVREMVSTGLVTVGSHTHTHALLDRSDDVAGELDRSIDLIRDRVGVAARDLAYPKAVAPSPAAEHEVRARFRSASLAGTRPNPYGGTDDHRLARSPIQRSDGMRYFEAKLAGGMRLEDDLRRMLNRLRYSGASS